MADVGFNRGSIAHRGESEVASWIATLARVGYASRGVLYIIMGALAIALALGTGGDTTGSRGALQTIADQPLGTLALIVIALGLAGRPHDQDLSDQQCRNAGAARSHLAALGHGGAPSDKEFRSRSEQACPGDAVSLRNREVGKRCPRRVACGGTTRDEPAARFSGRVVPGKLADRKLIEGWAMDARAGNYKKASEQE